MKKWLLGIGGFLVLVGFAILGRPARQLKKVERQRDDLIMQNTNAARAKAEKASAKADQLQADAAKAAEAGQKAIDQVGSNDETMRSVLDSWRADRVQ